MLGGTLFCGSSEASCRSFHGLDDELIGEMPVHVGNHPFGAPSACLRDRLGRCAGQQLDRKRLSGVVWIRDQPGSRGGELPLDCLSGTRRDVGDLGLIGMLGVGDHEGPKMRVYVALAPGELLGLPEPTQDGNGEPIAGTRRLPGKLLNEGLLLLGTGRI